MEGMHVFPSPLQLILTLAVIVVAYLVRGIAGFGSGLIAIPLLLLLNLPIALAVPLVVTLDYVASASQGLKNRQVIAWRDIWPLLPFTFVGVGSALYLFHNIDSGLLRDALGVFIIIYAAHSLLLKLPQRAQTHWWAVPAGGFGGLVGTLFGTGGPFYVIYLQLLRLDKTAFRATFATIFLIDGTSRIAGYVLTGFFTTDFLWALFALLPVMLLSLFFGGRVHAHFSQETFKRAINLLLFASGIALLLK